MKRELASKFIEKELKDLCISKGSRGYWLIYNNAIEGAEIMSRAELKKYIQDYFDSLPSTVLFV